MAFRVFLSHSLEPEDRALPWRLQTLAAAHGIQVYVPRRKVYQLGQTRYDAADKQDRSEMERSDCVLAIVTADGDPARLAIRDELGHAAGLKKLIVAIVQAGLEKLPPLKDLRDKRSVPSFVFSAGDHPGKMEGEVAEFLKKQGLRKENQQAISALVAISMGLLSLSSLAEK